MHQQERSTINATTLKPGKFRTDSISESTVRKMHIIEGGKYESLIPTLSKSKK